MDRNSSSIHSIRELFSPNSFVSDPTALQELTQNSIGIDREIVAAVYPETAAQVQSLVRKAVELAVPLYPISCGRNIGYGERAPAAE